MAVRRCEFEETGMPVVQAYEFEESFLTNGELRVKIFPQVSKEWAEFILMNRKARGRQMHDYDVVVGPVADDGVVYQLNLYMQRLITLDALVKELTFRKLSRQYFFGTERAIEKTETDMRLTKNQPQFFINSDVEQLVAYLHEDYKLPLLDAFDKVYGSRIYMKLGIQPRGSICKVLITSMIISRKSLPKLWIRRCRRSEKLLGVLRGLYHKT